MPETVLYGVDLSDFISLVPGRPHGRSTFSASYIPAKVCQKRFQGEQIIFYRQDCLGWTNAFPLITCTVFPHMLLNEEETLAQHYTSLSESVRRYPKESSFSTTGLPGQDNCLSTPLPHAKRSLMS